MSVKTKVYLLGHVTVPKLLDFLKNYNPVSNVYHGENEILPEAVQSVYQKYDDEKWYTDFGYIFFDIPNSVKRQLFYFYSNIAFCNNAERYYPPEVKKMFESETTYLSLVCDEAEIQIMKEIVSYFGGWINESDSDDDDYKSFYFIPGKQEKNGEDFLPGDIVQYSKREMHPEEQEEQLMVYQTLFGGEKKLCFRPIEDSLSDFRPMENLLSEINFLSEVNHDK